MTNLIVCLFLIAVIILSIASQVGYFNVLNSPIFYRKKKKIVEGDLHEPVGECFERRSLVEKSRPLLFHGMLWGILGISAVAILFALATRFGVACLIIGFFVTVSVIIFFQARSNVSYLMKLMQTTRCPKCGNIPMAYEGCSADKRRLLVCKQCRTEWDLGATGL